MIKKILSITALAMVLLSGCTSWVDEEPLSEGRYDSFFQNRFDADAGIAGMYGTFQQTMVSDGNFRNRYTFWGEGRSDNFERFRQYSTNTTNEMHFNSLTANNDFADWTGLYKVIGQANLLIKKLPDVNQNTTPGSVNELPATTLQNYIAQAYAMRALCYFYIVRVWGDAPIRTEPYLDLNENPERARDPKDKVLEQVISDLNQAYTMMPKGASATVFYINEGAIAAIMADVYMWKAGLSKNQQDYQNAIVWFKNVFKAKAPTGKVYNSAGSVTTGSGGAAADLQSTGTWKDMFTNPAQSVEAIWNIHWDYLANGCPCMAGVSTANNNTPYRIATGIFTTWGAVTDDIRVKQTFDITKKEQDRTWKWYPGVYTPPVPAVGTTPAQPYKYTGTFGSTLNVYMPVYRLSDQYLLYAEALNKTGDKANAVKYLNLIRTRANLSAVTAASFATETDLETAILQERQWELFGEGKRWFDLVRTDRVAQVMDPIIIARQVEQGAAQTGWGTDKRKYYWPLHRNVLNSNSLLVQNQPYSE